MEGQKKSRILSSTLARVVAFFILAISFMTGLVGTVGVAMLLSYEGYNKGVNDLAHDMMTSYIWSEVGYISTLYQENDLAAFESYFEGTNLDAEIYLMDGNVIGEDSEPVWSSLGRNSVEKKTEFVFNCYTSIWLEGDFRELLCRMYVDDAFPCDDVFRNIYYNAQRLAGYGDIAMIMAISGLFLFLCTFIYLMCSAGHHRGKEGINGGILYFFHFDILTVIFVSGGLLIAAGAFEMLRNIGFGYVDLFSAIVGVLLFGALAVWVTLYCMELAVELKLKTLFKHTLIYTVIHWVFKICGRGFRGIGRLLRGIPLVWGAIIAYGAFSIVQFVVLFFFCAIWGMDFDVLMLCLLEKLVLFPVILYFALVCKKLQKGSEALAEGELSYKLDTTNLFWGFKEHGENLNRIGEGIAVAVDQRMKSEHLKTELITNVSHDLKTPLTSIINYADLLGTAVNEEQIDRAQMEEYSEVLLRQSKRLKKLLEDLVEASKATTGNLEVNLVPCEVSVILSQAIGEYGGRFGEKELELIVRQPEEPVSIMADGKHLWRVFDNLLNNICKYAQDGSRVYLSVVPEEEQVEIIFRNMSKYALDISAEELQERFVRGDKSRHMEGNGLGLSIAGSLVELQKGTMDIVIDGDLFKVTLCFPTITA